MTTSKTIGAVYVATNYADGNSVRAFRQHDDGSLEVIGEYLTQGLGTGNVEIFHGSEHDPTHPLRDGIDPLISAYAVYPTPDGRTLVAVNPGDGTVTSFRIATDHSLEFATRVPAGERYPLSVATFGDLVYVASAGTGTEPPFTGNVAGYRLTGDGELTALEDAVRELGARPTCVAFTDDGRFLVVVELVTGLVKVFGVDEDGRLSDEPLSSVASPHDAESGRWLAIPVGFDLVRVADGTAVLVSEARFLDNQGGLRREDDKVPQSPLYSWQTGSTSSYLLSDDGDLRLVSGDQMTGEAMEGGQIANCWVEVSADGRHLWAANALSSSLSLYAIGEDASLRLMEEATYKDPSEMMFFSDLKLSQDGRYLNQLVGNRGEILVLATSEGGQVELVHTVDAGLPEVGAFGLATV